MTTSRPIPTQGLPIIWAAQVGSVAIMTGLAWWLPDLVPMEPVPAVRLPLLMAAAAAVLAVLPIARLLGLRGDQGGDVRRHPARPADAGAESRAGANPGAMAGRWVAVLAVAELPAVLGLLYALMGGARLHALGLGAASLMLMLLLPPRLATESARRG